VPAADVAGEENSKMPLRMTFWPMGRLAAVATLLTLALAGHAPAEEAPPGDFFAKTPAFSAGDQPATSWAGCSEVRAMSAALPATEARIDLSVTGKLTSIRTDGVLWYLTLCSSPDVRILCVAYSQNGMKPGDTVFAKGGYARVDPHHALLDPCLASDHLD
jgi:hypothetical protein